MGAKREEMEKRERLSVLPQGNHCSIPQETRVQRRVLDGRCAFVS